MHRAAKWVIDGISSLLFPPCCTICEKPVGNPEEVICASCRDSLAYVEIPLCETCGRPLPDGHEPGQLCGKCMSTSPPFDKARYAVFHQGNVRRALVNFKYGGLLHHGRGLSLLLTEAFQKFFGSSHIDFIVPMPMHPRRLIKRGFNQVVFLGGKLAEHTGIPMKRGALVKIRDTLPQVGLSRTQRLTNVKGSFGVSKSEELRGRQVLLLDDVSTTGSTIAEAALTLKKAGTTAVFVLVLALRIPASGNE
uniref:ComF family protein n=1 Tax=Desulfomonile tiedjei TaxID=2358 RepID=A0A7C4EWX5_9BACT